MCYVRSFRTTLTIEGMNFLAITKHTDVNLYVYTKSGSYNGAESNILQWALIASGTTRGWGEHKFTPIRFDSFTSVEVVAGLTRAFYITLIAAHVIYNKESAHDFIVARNNGL